MVGLVLQHARPLSCPFAALCCRPSSRHSLHPSLNSFDIRNESCFIAYCFLGTPPVYLSCGLYCFNPLLLLPVLALAGFAQHLLSVPCALCQCHSSAQSSLKLSPDLQSSIFLACGAGLQRFLPTMAAYQWRCDSSPQPSVNPRISGLLHRFLHPLRGCAFDF